MHSCRQANEVSFNLIWENLHTLAYKMKNLVKMFISFNPVITQSSEKEEPCAGKLFLYHLFLNQYNTDCHKNRFYCFNNCFYLDIFLTNIHHKADNNHHFWKFLWNKLLNRASNEHFRNEAHRETDLRKWFEESSKMKMKNDFMYLHSSKCG